MTSYYCCRTLERLIEEAGIIRFIDAEVARHYQLDLIEAGWQVIELDPAGERYYPIRFCPACGEMLDNSLSSATPGQSGRRAPGAKRHG